MKKTVLYLLLALLLAGCCGQPQTLSELNSEYVTIDDSVRVHYKLWNESAGSDAKTICFVHGFGCDMNTWEKQFEAFRDTKTYNSYSSTCLDTDKAISHMWNTHLISLPMPLMKY